MLLHTRRAGARLLIFALAALSGLPAWAEPSTPAAPSAQVQLDRQVHLAKLWGTVRYFHPYLAYRDLDWDAAAVAAIPRVRAAKTAGEYRQAVARMLAVLGDPATYVEPPPGSPAPAPVRVPPPTSPAAAARPPLFRWAEDGLLVVDFRPYSGYAIYTDLQNALPQLSAEIPKARAVIFDLRGEPGEGESGVDYSSALDGIAGLLVDRPLRAPSRRYLFHSGYRSQDISLDTYYSAFTTPFATAYAPASPEAAARAPKRVVFVVGRRTVLPEIALALQAGGQGRILSEGALASNANIATTAVDLGEGMTARVRTSETLPLPGWPGVHADSEIAEVAETAAGKPGAPDSALEAALALARAPGAVPAPASVSPLPEGVFQPDHSYREMRAPDLPYRLLAVFRFWNVIQYFYPYKALIGDWDAVLPQLLGRMETAEGDLAYAEAVLEMTTHVPDGHINVFGHPAFAKIRGESRLPIEVRWIEGSYVVTAADDSAKQAGVAIGDVLLAIDGAPVAARAAYLRRFVTASTEAALRDRIGGLLTGGAAGSTAVLTLSSDLARTGAGTGAGREVRIVRPAAGSYYLPARSGPVVQILPGNLGYVDLTRLEMSGVDGMFEQVAKTRGLIFDMRGYPHGTAWWIAPRLGKEGGKPECGSGRDSAAPRSRRSPMATTRRRASPSTRRCRSPPSPSTRLPR